MNPLGRWIARLRSWLRVSAPPRALPAPSGVPVAAAREEPPIDHVELLQRIWGEGYVLPGGDAGILKLVMPFGLDPSLSLGDLSAGLGGPARHVAHTFNLYITAFERSPELARRGHAMSVAEGFGRRVPIKAYDPETVELRPRQFNAVYAQFLTWPLADKPRFFEQVRRSLRPGGQLAILEATVGSAGDRFDPRLFRAFGTDAPLPWPAADYVACLADAGLDCRVVQDETALFRTQVLLGWQSCLAKVDKARIGRRTLLALLTEAERWFVLLQGLERKQVAITRFQAFVH